LAEKIRNVCKEHVVQEPATRDKVVHNGENDWKKNAEKGKKPDAVFVCTPWELHALWPLRARKRSPYMYYVEVPLSSYHRRNVEQ